MDVTGVVRSSCGSRNGERVLFLASALALPLAGAIPARHIKHHFRRLAMRATENAP